MGKINIIREERRETAVLVGIITQEQDEAKVNEYLDELAFLADTAGAIPVKRFTQKQPFWEQEKSRKWPNLSSRTR